MPIRSNPSAAPSPCSWLDTPCPAFTNPARAPAPPLLLYGAELSSRRRQLVQEQQGALAVRKSLSAEIGQLMKAKQTDEADKLKMRVEEANMAAARAEEELVVVRQDGRGGQRAVVAFGRVVWWLMVWSV